MVLPSSTIDGFIVSVSKNTANIIYEVDYNGRASYVNNYFYFHVRPDRKDCYMMRSDLLTAKFLVE